LRRSRIAWLAIVGLAALAVTAAACGDDNGEETMAETPTAVDGSRATFHSQFACPSMRDTSRRRARKQPHTPLFTATVIG
jgi:hypothetical protein